MLERYLEAPFSNFHRLVDSTNNQQILKRQQALQYLNLINNLGSYYSSNCNYDLINYQKIIYIEETFKDDEEIMSLINSIKKTISSSYAYKCKYIKRLINDIPRESFDNYYDEYLVKMLELNPYNNTQIVKEVQYEGTIS